jgi:cytochrome P450
MTEQVAEQLGALYNPFDPEFLADPAPVFQRIHDEAPVCYSDLFESWLITRYHDVVKALEGDVLVTRAGKMGPPPPAEVAAELEQGCPETPVLYNSEGPAYVRLRSLVERALSPELIASFEPTARLVANELVERFHDAGSAELVADLATPFADRTILEFVGVRRDDQAQVRAWNDAWATMFIPGEDLESQVAAARGMVACHRYHLKLIEDRRAEPRGDLVTALLDVRDERFEPLADAEIVWELMELTGVASNTGFGLANVLLELLREPARWNAVRTDASLVPAAIDESLRVETPILGSARAAGEELELGGVTIPEGAPVLVAYAAANHDREEFDDPERFDVHRPNSSEQLAMGRGKHSCVGAGLARMQIRVAIEVLGRRIPDLRLEDDFVPEFQAPFPFLRSVARLPVRSEPRRA